jgi:hypothetical protein
MPITGELSSSRGYITYAKTNPGTYEERRNIISDLIASHNDLSASHYDLSASHYDLSRNHLTLKNTVSDLSTSHYDLSRNHLTLKNTVSDLSTSHYDLSANHLTLKNNVSDLSVNQLSLKNNVSDLSVNQLSLKNNVNDLSVNQLSLKNNVSDLSVNQLSLKNNVNDLSVNQLSLKNNVNDLSTNHLNLKNTVSDLSVNHLNLKNTVSDLSTNHVSLKNNVNDLSVNQLTLKNTVNDLSTNNNIRFNNIDSSLGQVYTKTESDTLYVNKSNIDLSNLSTNIIPSVDNTYKLGDVSKNWRNAYIKDISATNIDISNKLNVIGPTQLANTLNVGGNVTFNSSTLYVPSEFTIDPYGYGDNTGTLFINGNLTVQGLTTTINSSVVDISDKMIVLASNAKNSIEATGAGLEISGANVRFIYDYPSSAFRSSIGISVSGNVVPATNSVVSLGESGKIWDIAYIRELNVTSFTNPINGANIAQETITTTQIANGSILTVDICDHAITYEKIAANAVTNTRIANGAVTHAKLSSDCIQSHNIVDGTIMDVDISANAGILGSKLANNSITSDKIDQSNNWTFSQLTSNTAYIRDISVTNISVSGNIIPLDASRSDLGSLSKRWRNIYANDISINTINGQVYSAGGSAINLTSVSGNIIPSINNQFKLGDVSRNWSNAYIRDISATNTTTNSLNIDGIINLVKHNETISKYIQIGQDLDGEIQPYQNLLGWSVSINSAGNIVAIGAKNNMGNSVWPFGAGHVVIYKYNDISWIKIGELDGTEVGEQSGFSVSLNDEGNIVAIGSPYKNGGDVDRGSVKIYKYNNVIWQPIGDIIGEAQDDKSGYSVSLNGLGNIVAIFAPQADGIYGVDMGHVRIYKYNDVSWVKLGDDIDGTTFIHPDNVTYNITPNLSLNNLGNIVAIGDPFNSTISDNRGQVRVYKYNDISWIQLSGNILNGEATTNYFGWSVSLNSSGNILAVGAINNSGITGNSSGHVRVFKYNDISWIQIGQDIDGEAADNLSGNSVSLNDEGTIVAIGARENLNGTGHVRVYKYNDVSWVQYGVDIDGEALGDKFGQSVSLNSTGNILAVGGPYNDGANSQAGHVRVYKFFDILVESKVISSNIVPFTNNIYTLGTSSLQWKNAYINDLNINNNLQVIGNVKINGNLDASNVYTKSQIDGSFANVYTKSIIDNSFANVYTKSQIDNSFANVYTKSIIDGSFANVYTKSIIDNSFANVYTKSQIDGSFANVYTKSQIDNSFANVYTKSIIDNSFANVYTKSQIDGSFANVYTKSQIDGSFVTKSVFELSLNNLTTLRNSYLDFSVGSIGVSGNILPLFDISSDLGSSLKRWRNIYVNDLSVNTINGQAYNAAPNLTSVSGDIIPFSNVNFKLGDVSRNWSNAYIRDISASNISVSGNFILNIGGTMSDITDTFNSLGNTFDAITTSISNIDFKVIDLSNNKANSANPTFSGVISVSGNILPLNPLSGNLGTSSNPWGNANIRDLSIGSIDVNINLNPSFTNNGTIGSSTRIWGNANIKDISASNISISGNIVPLLDISSNLGSETRRWNNIYVNDLSVNRINGQVYSAGGGGGGTAIDLTSVSTNIIPASNNNFKLGDVSRNWSNAYIRDISASNISVSGNIIFNVSGASMRIAADVSNFSITTTHRLYQNISGGINDLSWSAVNGYYALTEDAYPSLNPLSSGNLAVITWTGRLQGVPADCFWRDVCWSPQLRLFVAVGAKNPNAYVIYSSNGIDWNSVNVDNNDWFCVEWSPQLGIFVALAMGGLTNNRLMTSTNGTSWTMRTLPVNNRWMDVCWSPELGIFVATAEGPGTINKVMTSSNGIDWSLQSPSENNSWYGVCWSPQLMLFVAVAGSGTNRVMVSNNGINWQPIGLSQGVPQIFWLSICWSPQLGLFVAVAAGWGGGNNNYIMTSLNGRTWTTISNPHNYGGTGGICWSPELRLFVAVSYSLGRIVTSPDGITWTTRQYTGGDMVGVCWSPELGIFVVANGIGSNRVMTSSLKGRPPTSYNVFDSSFNSIDETGKWTFVNVATTTLTVNGSNVTSDDRVKHNEAIITNGLTIIDQLTPKFYQKTLTMLDASYNGDLSGITWNYEAGLIAQELLHVNDISYVVSGGDYYQESYKLIRQTNETSNNLIPQSYDPSSNYYEISHNLITQAYTVNYNSIFVYGLAAIKELHTKVKAQETIISSLIARIQSLENSSQI